MKIAVIIPAHNEADYLPGILATVRVQTRLPNSVVVVSDASTDTTTATARRIFADWSAAGIDVDCRVLEVDVRSIAGARNRGMQSLSLNDAADAFLCVDADSLLSENVLASMESALHEGCDYGGFQLLLDSRLDSKRSASDKLLAKIWLAGVHWSNKRLGNFVGTGIFFRRDANDGYDESWGWAEDIELCERMRGTGKRWKYIDNATLVYCDRRFIERGYWKEIFVRIGRGLGHYRKGGLRFRGSLVEKKP